MTIQLTFDQTKNACSFQTKLAERGHLGYEALEFPAPSKTRDYDTLIPDPSPSPFNNTPSRELHNLAETPGLTTLFLSSTINPTELLHTYASNTETALLPLQGGMTNPHNTYGVYTIENDQKTWNPGLIPKALHMTTNGPVLLHITDVSGMDEQERNALLGLFACLTTVNFTGDDLQHANLENLTVVFSDAASPPVMQQLLGSATTFSHVFDATIRLNPQTLYEEAAETEALMEVLSIPEQWASMFAEVATALRDLTANEEAGFDISVSHVAIRKWASTAYAFHQQGVEIPVRKAAYHSSFFALCESEKGREIVSGIIDQCRFERD